jgi:mRNA interferase MazF
MKRGEIWTLRDAHFASKARPVVIIQADPEDSFDSVILCLFTTFESDNIPTRIRIKGTSKNFSF